jgi:hypothetical protein
MKLSDLHTLARALGPALKDALLERDRRLVLHEQRLMAAERRLAALESREYQGVWSAEQAYAKGAMVTQGGSLWHSNAAENRTKPGESEQWTLCVKKGRDAR